MDLHEIFSKSNLIFEAAKDGGRDGGILGRLKFDFITADRKNDNNRIYSSDLLTKEIGRFKEHLRTSKIAGQLNHPVTGGHTELDKISHVITDVDFDPETKKGVATSAILNTSKGRDLKVLLDANVPFGASVRGRGKVDASGKIDDDYQLFSIDLVSSPSFGDDTMITKANLIESGNRFFISKILTEDQQRSLYEFDLDAGMRVVSFEEWKKAFARTPDTMGERFSAARSAGFRGTEEEYRASLKR